ncbi:divalent-cation tolerance protein CutA [Salipiger mucosus]|uniref:Periplasmic divalent cation tolerance protein CutA n=1 Tax=Salipiger mucosus DSM 16094 TaxID=1123237 RepID=S9Q797_9RHOB|nr:divalent-cation tolerance protein CutA [Salipiger mucosus]EPX75907.1 Periplasmic divalent cation tolerance protein CutA [Salipiger mucosus DSM 16094]
MPLAVFTTTDSETEARDLARGAVERHLAACVQVERITSVYDWQGIQEDAEFRLLFKTSAERYDALAAFILERHSYDEPALWGVEMTHGSPSFLQWIDETSTG